jgi:copper chaperone CopZ
MNADGLNEHRLAAVVVGFVVFLLIPSWSRAELLAADLDVRGMTCPFCAFGVEKKLGAIDGVQEVSILLDEGVIRLVFSRANEATAGDIQRAVEEAGFSLLKGKLKVRGRLVRASNEIILDAGSKARFRLLETRAGGTGPLSAETGAAMEKVSGGRSLVVHGIVSALSAELPGLVVEGYEEDRAKAP